MVTSLSPVVFLMPCWEIVEPPRVELPVSLPRMAFAVLFQLVTLPVEFNASHRAMDYLQTVGVESGRQSYGEVVDLLTAWYFSQETTQ